MAEGTDAVTTITVHPEDGTTVTTPAGHELSTPTPTDLGLGDACAILHDAAHALLAAHVGLEASPVLERVATGAPLSQEHVDLEEAATFAIQAWCAALRGEDHRPAIANVRTALDRLEHEKHLPVRHVADGVWIKDRPDQVIEGQWSRYVRIPGSFS